MYQDQFQSVWKAIGSLACGSISESVHVLGREQPISTHRNDHVIARAVFVLSAIGCTSKGLFVVVLRYSNSISVISWRRYDV